MNEENGDFDDFDDFDDFEDFAEESEMSGSPQDKRLAWKRIESIKDRIALRKAVSDFDDYYV